MNKWASYTKISRPSYDVRSPSRLSERSSPMAQKKPPSDGKVEKQYDLVEVVKSVCELVVAIGVAATSVEHLIVTLAHVASTAC